MIASIRDSQALLQQLTDAYAAGDAPLGEHLLGQALDAGEAWDKVCAAAARGIAQRHTDPDTTMPQAEHARA